jgi:hypothetical protein
VLGLYGGGVLCVVCCGAASGLQLRAPGMQMNILKYENENDADNSNSELNSTIPIGNWQLAFGIGI